ncbi:MAG: response regulator [Nitrososphaeraceae archaeon]
MSLKLLPESSKGIRRQFHIINHRAPSFFSPFIPNFGISRYLFCTFSLNTNSENQVRDYHPATHSTIANNRSKILSPVNTNKRILIVDDEQDIATLFKVALERAGFIVDVFNDPLESLSSYKAGAYDLLLLDIKMPQMSGFELYDKIKHIDDKVKVCFITAFEEYYDEFKKQFPYLEETECFIRKPVGVEDLIRKVKSQLTYN